MTQLHPDIYKNQLFITISKIGHYAPIFIFCLIVFLLQTRQYYCIAYPIGCFINMLINNILKNLIKQKRPPNPINASFDPNEYYEKWSNEYYGMPSGHSQFMSFSLSYLFLVSSTQYGSLLLLMAFITIITVSERWLWKRHTIEQIVVGLLLGSIVAYVYIALIKHLFRSSWSRFSHIHWNDYL